jgi:hypothetical protein
MKRKYSKHRNRTKGKKKHSRKKYSKRRYSRKRKSYKGRSHKRNNRKSYQQRGGMDVSVEAQEEDDLVCPIDLCIMVNPVRLVKGGRPLSQEPKHVFEDAAIRGWLYTHRSHPITREDGFFPLHITPAGDIAERIASRAERIASRAGGGAGADASPAQVRDDNWARQIKKLPEDVRQWWNSLPADQRMNISKGVVVVGLGAAAAAAGVAAAGGAAATEAATGGFLSSWAGKLGTGLATMGNLFSQTPETGGAVVAGGAPGPPPALAQHGLGGAASTTQPGGFMPQQSTNRVYTFPKVPGNIEYKYLGKMSARKLNKLRKDPQYGNYVKIEELITDGEKYRENIQYILDMGSLREEDKHDETFKQFLREFVAFGKSWISQSAFFHVSPMIRKDAKEFLAIYFEIARALEPIVRRLD